MSSTFLIVLLTLAGTSLAARLPYIIGGDIVYYIDFWPWQGSVHTGSGDFVCGCSLISAEFAVTAASCVTSPPYIVRFGSVNRSEGTIRPVRDVIAHENYRVVGDYRYNDVAVLKFDPLLLSVKINIIPLGGTNEEGNDNCDITGWGLLSSSDSNKPEVLHQGKVSIVTNLNCDNRWPNIDDGHICTDSIGFPRACRGDTGGPLVCYKTDHHELVGISSWQISDCHSSYYPVYTRVSYFKSWIEGKVQAAHK